MLLDSIRDSSIFLNSGRFLTGFLLLLLSSLRSKSFPVIVSYSIPSFNLHNLKCIKLIQSFVTKINFSKLTYGITEREENIEERVRSINDVL